MIAIEHTARATAPVEVVWSVLSDFTRWHEWGPWVKTEIDGDGVGALRTMTSDRTKSITRQPYVLRERVTEFEPPTRFGYDLESGLPVRNYSAEVTLLDAGGGTDIRWRASFDPPWPILGGLWRGAMLKVVRDVSQRLARAAELKAAG